MFASAGVDATVKRTKLTQVCSWNNEIHLVIQEDESIEHPRRREVFNFSEIKKIMKKEAAKPLFLKRNE